MRYVRSTLMLPPWPSELQHVRESSLPEWYTSYDTLVIKPKESFVVIALGASTAGYIQATRSLRRPTDAHIVEAAVMAEMRQQGIGRGLLIEVARWLIELGCETLTATALAGPEFADRDMLLGRLGFARHRDYDRIISLTDPAIFGVKEAPAPSRIVRRDQEPV